MVGTIPPGIKDVNITLKSDKDIDIQLYGVDGIAIVAWPKALLSKAGKQSVVYHGMKIEWSGYNGTNGHKGHEYIKLTGKTTEMLVMKVYGFQAGKAEVTYSWGNNNKTKSMEELEKILNDPNIPSTTESDFNKTEFAKHHLSAEKTEKLARAHVLVLTAKDPDPEWIYTNVDKADVMVEAGTEHTFTLKKCIWMVRYMHQ